jgi:hypothetical protein
MNPSMCGRMVEVASTGGHRTAPTAYYWCYQSPGGPRVRYQPGNIVSIPTIRDVRSAARGACPVEQYSTLTCLLLVTVSWLGWRLDTKLFEDSWRVRDDAKRGHLTVTEGYGCGHRRRKVFARGGDGRRHR